MALALELAAHQGNVRLAHRARSKRLIEKHGSRVGPRVHEQPTRALVDAMDGACGSKCIRTVGHGWQRPANSVGQEVGRLIALHSNASRLHANGEMLIDVRPF